MMMSEGEGSTRRKRKIGEALMVAQIDLALPAVLPHVMPAAVADVVSRLISALIGKFFQQEQPDMDAEVARLERLVTMLHAAVDAADGVHIRSWWLRRWLWTIRDAALEGADVARSFRRRAVEENRHRQREERRWWGPLLRRSGKDDKGSWDTVRREVVRLEEIANGMGNFLMLLHMETGVPPPPIPPQQWLPPGIIKPAALGDVGSRLSSASTCINVVRPTQLDMAERNITFNIAKYSSALEPEAACGDADSSIVGDQLERLAVLVIMAHSAVDKADERVQHIRSGSLCRWLWKLQNAALQGDEVLRLFRQKRASSLLEDAATTSGSRSPWKAAASKFAHFGSVNKITQFITGHGGGGNNTNRGSRLRLTLESLEGISSSIGVFLHKIYMEMEIPVTGPIIFQRGATCPYMEMELGAPGAIPAAALGFPTTPDIARLHCLVVYIRRAVAASDRPEVHGKRWLADWRLKLQAVADTADRVLLALPTVPPGHAETQANILQVRRTAQQSLETAAAHLGDFVVLVRFAVIANALP